MSDDRDERRDQQRIQQMILDLLRGDCRILGERVELTFPDGQPFGASNTELADMFDPSLRSFRGAGATEGKPE
jgi:hypothetical protein